MINLFDKRINGFLTKMDDSTSMVSLALRDSLESSGRTYMEYKRDPHGGRERLIEEAATMVIWGFGINWMKKAYDYMAKDMFKAIDLPGLDTALLKQVKAPESNQSKLKAYFNPPSAQSLVKADGKMNGEIEKFIQAVHKHSDTPIYDKLTHVIGDQSKKTLYNGSNMLKFGFATLIPVAGIALGIPSFNQWLTKTKIEKERALQQKQQQASNKAAVAVGAQPPFPAGKALFTPVQTMNPAPSFNRFGTATNSLPYPYANGLANTSAQPIQSGNPQNPFAPVGNTNPNINPMTPSPFTGSKAVRFGGLGDLGGNVAASLLQNERANTLLVDNFISGGRITKARNWQERVEITFRELSIIACLYWGQQALQKAFINLGKNSHSQLSFDATKHLKEKFLNPQSTESATSFADNYSKHLDDLAKLMGYEARNGKDPGKQLLETLKQAHKPEMQYKLDKGFTTAVLEHFKEAPGKRADNLFLDVAKECHWIPTFDGEAAASKNVVETVTHSVKGLFKNTGDGLKALLSQNATDYTPKAGKYLDLTQKIKSDSMFSFIESMERAFVSEGLKDAPQKLEAVLKKSIRGRAGAWLASNAVCTLLLSYIIPKTQHYMTYKMTGKNYFPGVQQEG